MITADSNGEFKFKADAVAAAKRSVALGKMIRNNFPKKENPELTAVATVYEKAAEGMLKLVEHHHSGVGKVSFEIAVFADEIHDLTQKLVDAIQVAEEKEPAPPVGEAQAALPKLGGN